MYKTSKKMTILASLAAAGALACGMIPTTALAADGIVDDEALRVVDTSKVEQITVNYVLNVDRKTNISMRTATYTKDEINKGKTAYPTPGELVQSLLAQPEYKDVEYINGAFSLFVQGTGSKKQFSIVKTDGFDYYKDSGNEYPARYGFNVQGRYQLKTTDSHRGSVPYTSTMTWEDLIMCITEVNDGGTTANGQITVLYDNPKPFKVTYVDGITGDEITTEINKDDTSVPEIVGPSHDGYVSAGTDEIVDPTTGDVTVTLKYTKTDGQTYNVSFIDSLTGEVIATVPTAAGTAAAAPAAPTHNGYRFVSWDGDFSNVSSDLTIKAIYEKADTLTSTAPAAGSSNNSSSSGSSSGSSKSLAQTGDVAFPLGAAALFIGAGAAIYMMGRRYTRK